MAEFTSNAQLLAAVQALVDAWCDRRCLSALRHILAGYPLPSPLTDGWGALYDGLRHVRALDRDQLTDAERDMVDDLIVAVGRAVYRGTPPGDPPG